eukprot:CAMPEP_0115434704 /NCGR_PEP_ID=MMETSP0271-20121206/33282_1 /TAXON_ID=71861 /ORGANISM="Scrippsiella trochoidea, Strain CCMP3099" /LENGTH=379 /DNA_ID=CAMNT_0002860141 /DNA_START=56 /DNA_END=1196 /DNA_ORIENTATION=+
MALVISRPLNEVLLRVKVLMVIIVYLSNFNLLLLTIRSLLFVLNPLTWLEVSDHWPQGSGGLMFKFGKHGVWAFLALSMRLVVGYCVCVDSVSVILNSVTPAEAIFNSLAITFIVDLSQCWWDFCASIFHFTAMEEFEFEMEETSQVWTETGDVHPEKLEKCSFPGCVCWIIRWTKTRITGDRSLLCRGYGYRMCEKLTAFIVLYLIYRRQFYLVLFAVHTKVLPVARDLCTQWRLHAGKTLLSQIFVLAERSLVVSIDHALEEMGEVSDKCDGDEKYHPMRVDDEQELWNEYWKSCIMFEMMFLCILVVPQISFVVMHSLFPEETAERLLDADEEQEQEIVTLQRKQAETEEIVKEQDEKIEKLIEELRQLQQSASVR